MPYGDGTGRTIRIAKHAMNVAKSKEMMRFLGTNTLLLYALHEAGMGAGLVTSKIPIPFKSSGVFPTGPPPTLDALLGMGKAMYGTLVGDERMVADGTWRLKRQLPTHIIPGYNVLRKMRRVYRAELPPKALFLPTTEAEYKEWRR